MSEVQLSSKNQMVLPKKIRELSGLQAGDKLLVDYIDGSILITPKPKSFTKKLLGSARGIYEEDYLSKERKSWSK